MHTIKLGLVTLVPKEDYKEPGTGGSNDACGISAVQSVTLEIIGCIIKMQVYSTRHAKMPSAL